MKNDLRKLQDICCALREEYGLASLMMIGVTTDAKVAIAADVDEAVQEHLPAVLRAVAIDIAEQFPLRDSAESRPN